MTMSTFKRLTFVLDVESDQETPDIGTTFDVESDQWHFFDAQLQSIDVLTDEA